MQLHEMEEQIKNINARTTSIEQFLPTLATKQDLRDEVAKLATKDDLRLTTDALQHEMATLATKDDLRLTAEALRHEMATKDDLRLSIAALQHEMARFATKEELTAGLEDAKRYTLLLIQTTRGEIRQIREEMATKEDLQRLELTLSTQTAAIVQRLQRTLSKQIAALRAPGRMKR
jgi:hypothetical protein